MRDDRVDVLVQCSAVCTHRNLVAPTLRIGDVNCAVQHLAVLGEVLADSVGHAAVDPEVGEVARVGRLAGRRFEDAVLRDDRRQRMLEVGKGRQPVPLRRDLRAVEQQPLEGGALGVGSATSPKEAMRACRIRSLTSPASFASLIDCDAAPRSPRTGS